MPYNALKARLKARILEKPDSAAMSTRLPPPVWMSRAFSELSIYPVSFSKYGRYYREYLLREEGAEPEYKQNTVKGGRVCA